MKSSAGKIWLPFWTVTLGMVLSCGAVFGQQGGGGNTDESSEGEEIRVPEKKGSADVGAAMALYVWNRVADFFEVFDVGLALGPSVGGEVAFTEKHQLAAHYSAEAGFTSTLPPFWFIPLFDGEEVARTHSGVYKRIAYGERRWENTVRQDVRFPRKPNSFRLQLGLGLAHFHGAVDFTEGKDFFGGIVGKDWGKDDQSLDPLVHRQPARQLGRSIVNITLGVLEIPINMIDVNETRGHFAGFTYGAVRGVWRFLVRESVGVFELVSFPMGWSPIVRPEYILEKDAMTNWKVDAPEFRK